MPAEVDKRRSFNMLRIVDNSHDQEVKNNTKNKAELIVDLPCNNQPFMPTELLHLIMDESLKVNTKIILLQSIAAPSTSYSMEKKSLFADGVFWDHPFHVLLSILLALVFTDPLHIGPLGGHNFKPVKHSVAPYAEVMASWPRDNHSRLRFGNRQFVDEVYGPESLEFDLEGRGPYTGLADGRVVRWMGDAAGWETFALVSPNWSESMCANGIYSTTHKQLKHEEQCGRPLGLRFDRKTGDLYIADAYYGLLVVGPDGGIATPLAPQVGGRRILFANDLDIHKNGSIFFTDTSTRYNRQNHFFILLEGEGTGRLLKYDPHTRTTSVVLDGLAFPNGVQISKDHTYLLFTETTNSRIMKYWLEGPKKGNLEVFANLAGFPDNIRSNKKGQFWVAIDCCRTPIQEHLSRHPWIKSIYFRLPFKLSILARLMGMRMYTVITLFNENGEIAEVMEDQRGEVVKLVSEVQEFDGKIWIGTVAHNHIVTLPFPPNSNE